MPVALRKPDQHHAAHMWRVRSLAIQAIPPRFYAAASLSVWASVPMPAEFPEVIAGLNSVIAVCGGQVIGWGRLDHKTSQLEALFVDPGFQRRGAACQIYFHLEATARQAGMRSLRLSSTLNAVPFYEYVGFAPRTRSVYHHPHGFDVECIQMDKDLGAARQRTQHPGRRR